MRYRVAVRYVEDRQRYHLEDIEAASMAEALRAVVDRVPNAILAVSDLVEVRPQVSDDERVYSPG